jgi:hypothetical protein
MLRLPLMIGFEKDQYDEGVCLLIGFESKLPEQVKHEDKMPNFSQLLDY